MSRKEQLKSSHHTSNHSNRFESSFAVAQKWWKKLRNKLRLNGSHQDSQSDKNDVELPADPPKQITFIKGLIHLFRKLKKRKPPSFDPKEIQREILEEIGQQLYQTRQKQQLSLQKISTETRISIGLLTSIERGQVEELPEAIYTRGLIKKFADCLGLNGKTLAERYPTDVTPNTSKTFSSRVGIPILQFRPIHLYFLYILIVIISVQSISNNLKRAALEGKIEELPIPSSVDTQLSQPTQKPVTIQVNITGKCQLKVIVDGKVDFEGVLPKNTQKTWEANQSITIRASDAGQVLVAFNRQQAKRLGKLGEQKEVTYQLKKTSQNSLEN